MSSGGRAARYRHLLLAVVILLTACTLDSPSPVTVVSVGQVMETDGLRVTVLQAGLEVPWDLAFTPDGRMLVTERPGRVSVYASAQPGAQRIGTLAIPDALATGESGSMGIAVDRDFARYPFAYVCATRDLDGVDGPMPAENQLLRLRIGGAGSLELDADPLLSGMKANEHHNGCAVEMDGDQRIWLTMGDANSARGADLAQDPQSLNGKVLRIERDGSAAADNPTLAGALAPGAAYSMGHRNPQGIAIRDDGTIVVAEHGTDRDDELNVVVAGGNYGYACWTDTDVLGPAQEQEGPARDGCRSAADYLPAAWSSGQPTIAPSNITFLHGALWGDWEDQLVAATLKESDLRRFSLDDGLEEIRQEAVMLDGAFGRLRATVIGPDGALYVTTSNGANDVVLRITRD